MNDAKRRLSVTFNFRGGRQETHPADAFTTEDHIQYRIDQDTDILLFPMSNVLSVRIRRTAYWTELDG